MEQLLGMACMLQSATDGAAQFDGGVEWSIERVVRLIFLWQRAQPRFAQNRTVRQT
jgi:hypothetical protein